MDQARAEENESESGKIDVTSQSDGADNIAELHRKINEESNKIAYLSKTLEQKDDLIKLLLKEKSILECEKNLVSVCNTLVQLEYPLHLNYLSNIEL